MRWRTPENSGAKRQAEQGHHQCVHLILAAAAFNGTGNTGVEELEKVHALLSPLLGSAIAPTLFAIALLCCGLSSTVTATMAGQIVMQGFLDIQLPPWLCCLVMRLMAIVPAAAVTIAYGESGTAKLLSSVR